MLKPDLTKGHYRNRCFGETNLAYALLKRVGKKNHQIVPRIPCTKYIT